MTTDSLSSSGEGMARNGMLVGGDSKKLGDLALNKLDLEFCRDLLKEHSQVFEQPSSNLSRALWAAVITRFVCCFDKNSNSRNHIDYKMVFENNKKMLEVFELFKNLRDKHFSHDDNYYYQQRVAVNIDEKDEIKEVITVAIRADTNNNMYSLAFEIIEKSIAYVEKRIEILGREIFNETKNLTKENIKNLPSLSFSGNVLDANKNRLANSLSSSKEKIPSIILSSGRVIFSMTIKVDLAWRP